MIADRELQFWQALATLPWPRRVGVAHRIFRRIYLRRNRPQIVSWVDDLRLTLDPQEHVDGLWLFTPDHVDAKERAFLFDDLPTGGVFIDLGAYIGTYALLAGKKLGPSGTVLAVEPHPDTFQRLWAHIQENSLPHVIPVQVAVSDSPGKTPLGSGVPGNRAARSTLDPKGTLEVVALPLIEVLNKHDITHISALKADLEGMEFRVFSHFFANAPRTLHPQRIVFEMDPPVPGLIDLFERHGYRVSRLSRLNFGAERE